MEQSVLARPRRLSWRALPWWGKVLVLFVLSRLVTGLLLQIFALNQPYNPWTDASPSYTDYASIWDGFWYFRVATLGYPSELPLEHSGQVAQNTWAFMPVYPGVVRALMFLTGLEWSVAAVIVSVLCAAGSALLFYRLMTRVLPEATAMFAVAVYLSAPLSPILQVAYAESMQLLLLNLGLILVLDRRYGLLIPVVIVMSFVRPTGLAFALFLGLHMLLRIRNRHQESFGPRQWRTLIAAGLLSAASGFAWSVIAGLVTGSPSAYTDTEIAWRATFTSNGGGFEPFTAWFQAAYWWLYFLTHGAAWAGWSVVVIVVPVLIFIGILFLPAVRRLGPDLRLWMASYGLYLLAVFFPQTSTFRMLMPMFPLAGALAQPRSRWYRVAIITLGILGQVLWLRLCWWVDYSDWTPP